MKRLLSLLLCAVLALFCATTAQAAGVSITLGSDAHIASDICFGILEAQKHAFAAGYRTFDVPRADGSWESWNL